MIPPLSRASSAVLPNHLLAVTASADPAVGAK
jgi:hypothetical protein